MQPACQSSNYNLADKICQFNNDTKHFRPKYFVEKANSVYADNPDSGKLFVQLKKKKRSSNLLLLLLFPGLLFSKSSMIVVLTLYFLHL